MPLTKNPETGDYGDPRAEKYIEKYGPWFVELDALKPSILKEIVRKRVRELLDLEAFQQDLNTEYTEKEFLEEYLLKEFDECMKTWKRDQLFD